MFGGCVITLLEVLVSTTLERIYKKDKKVKKIHSILNYILFIYLKTSSYFRISIRVSILLTPTMIFVSIRRVSLSLNFS